MVRLLREVGLLPKLRRSNRTIVGLKQTTVDDGDLESKCSNRTIVGLKPIDVPCVVICLDRAAIAPLWD